MPEDRTKFMIRMSPETQEKIKQLYKQDNCKSQNEFIEKAILYYVSVVAARDSAPFLSQTLTDTLRGMLDDSDGRMARMLFKLVVEVDILTHILAVSYEIDEGYLRSLRGKCVEEVKRTNGNMTLDQIVRGQKTASGNPPDAVY